MVMMPKAVGEVVHNKYTIHPGESVSSGWIVCKHPTNYM